MTEKLKVSIVGASGYGGGELLRLMLFHPGVEVVQATSESKAGEFVFQTHPNLRKRTQLQFVSQQALQPCDVLFLALPHGQAQKKIAHYQGLAPRIVDLSADFRLKNLALYEQFYGEPHSAPEQIGQWVYGLPELTREALRTAKYVSGVGCNATASNLAILPLAKAGLLVDDRPIIVDVKTGSSEGGASVNAGSHHPEKSHSVRTYSAVGHRHTAEVIETFGRADVHLTMTAVDLVRGVLAAAHCFVKPGTTEKDLWKAYRGAYKDEPFVRIVKDKTGIHRVPDPKILAGSNYVDVGFELDPRTHRVVSLAAIDNLMKGASGSAVQAFNIMCGFEETTGLEFPGLHPV
ncbi:MAG TPA: N-acetyl-gamma-glutamyl-phosphate reductase [Anaerolineales bacterium]|nr:N-acetyl-gamma-glutamyl-phosphate reductase [Anaerolineales bacterium]